MPLKPLKQIKWLLLSSLSVGIFFLIAYSQQLQALVPSPSFWANTLHPNYTLSQDVPSSPSPAESPSRAPDVVYVPTPDVVVEKMLELARVSKEDVIYDLGSGDGRIVITAAQKYGARGIGVEIRPDLVRKAKENAQKAGVSDRVQFLQQDLFQTDLSSATVVTLYLLPHLNLKLRSKLFDQLKPGSRVVSHNYHMGDWKPQGVQQIEASNSVHTIYYWVVPRKMPEGLR
jgi:protein-L-isoaspartate O-methyltransferase